MEDLAEGQAQRGDYQRAVSSELSAPSLACALRVDLI